MSRSPHRNDYFPPIKTIYDDSYGSARKNSGQMIPYNRMNSGINSEKIGEFEFRLDVQERTTQQLIDKAIQVKQNLIENLNFTQGTWMEEKEARELLQEHVRTITAVIRQMNKEIKTIESTIKEKETTNSGTNNIIRQLENNQISSISEIRGRIGRCDSVAAKLANDIRLVGESVKAIGIDLGQMTSKFNEKLQNIELKNQDLYNKIDRLNSESNTNIRISVDETNKQLFELDNRTKLIFDDVRHQIKNFQMQTEVDKEKFESKMFTTFDKSFTSFDARLTKLEENMNSDRHIKVLLDRLENFENEYKIFRKDRIGFEKDVEKRMTDHSDRLYRQQIDDLSRFKREVRDSFAAVYETVNMMQSMFEKKQKLIEDNLRKEMTQLRKMVVLI